MEQIAVRAWRFRLMPSDPVTDFEATYFINSDGSYSVMNEFYSASNAPLSWWQFTVNSEGKKWITFWSGGESFDIIDDDQSSIAIPFFEKHLIHLEKRS